MHQRRRVNLREVGGCSTISLPNIATPKTSVPEIQISSEENAKFSTESKAFWDETTQLLQDISMLHRDVGDITCPCNKPDCPFKHNVSGTGARKSRSISIEEQLPSLMASRGSCYLSPSACCNIATYLASMQPTRSTAAIETLFRQDCQVTEEPLAGGKDHFVRNSPFRMARRRHNAIRVSASYPTTMNNLMVPSCLRSNSLPNAFECPLYIGSSLDSLDSDKMHDIQKSFVRGQHHMSV